MFSINKNIALLKGEYPRRGPDFFIIGATRSGTTYLHHLLKQHPDIFMPQTKELHYFNSNGKYSKDLKKYLGMFYGYKKEKLIGEATPLYFEKGTLYDSDGRILFFQNETAIERLHHHYPDAKIIISLRDPIDRIESIYSKNFSQGKVTTTLQEEIGQELADGSRLHLLYRNRYDIHLKEIFKYYPQKQVSIIIFEDWVSDTNKALSDISSFIGAPYVEINGDEETRNTRESYQKRGSSSGMELKLSLNQETANIIKDELSPVYPYLNELLARTLPWKYG